MNKATELYNLLNSITESSAFTVKNLGIINKTLFLEVNGIKYGYNTNTPGLTIKDIENKFNKMKKFSIGKAFAWVKKSTKLASGSIKEKSKLTI